MMLSVGLIAAIGPRAGTSSFRRSPFARMFIRRNAGALAPQIARTPADKADQMLDQGFSWHRGILGYSADIWSPYPEVAPIRKTELPSGRRWPTTKPRCCLPARNR